MKRILLAIVLAAGLTVALAAVMAPTSASTQPQGQHCGDGGPLGDPEYCGCTWGEVVFRGQAVAGAVLTLTFAGQTVTDVVAHYTPDELPYYSLTGHDLGAKRGDVITLTASFAGEVVTRTIRALPDDDGEQHVVLAFPEREAFVPYLDIGYTRTLAVDGSTLWAGGPDGLASVDVLSGDITPHTLPWQQGGVEVLAVRNATEIWVAAGSALARMNDGVWNQVSPPPSLDAIRALAVDPVSGDLWVGGAAGPAGIAARYTDAWHDLKSFGQPVTAVTLDENGAVWAGTWGDGAYQRREDGGWTRFRDVDGLASNRVLSLAAANGFMWIGGAPYLSGLGPRGGIGRYDLNLGSWQSYGTAQGLPAAPDGLNPNLPAPVLALAIDEAGVPWAGTSSGVYALAAPSWWNRYSAGSGASMPEVIAIAASGPVFVGTHSGISRLQQSMTPGSPPVAVIAATQPATVTKGIDREFVIDSTGADTDEGGLEVIAWDWTSDRDGPLCTKALCVLKVDALSLGDHVLSLRVQDDEGAWSPVQTTQLSVVDSKRTYLPALRLGWAGSH